MGRGGRRPSGELRPWQQGAQSETLPFTSPCCSWGAAWGPFLRCSGVVPAQPGLQQLSHHPSGQPCPEAALAILSLPPPRPCERSGRAGGELGKELASPQRRLPGSMCTSDTGTLTDLRVGTGTERCLGAWGRPLSSPPAGPQSVPGPVRLLQSRAGLVQRPGRAGPAWGPPRRPTLYSLSDLGQVLKSPASAS